MKILRYVLGVSMLLSSIDLIVPISTSLYACPRCRRALPKGPKKLPHPAYSNNYLTAAKNSAAQSQNSRSCCCCVQQKTSSTQKQQAENLK